MNPTCPCCDSPTRSEPYEHPPLYGTLYICTKDSCGFRFTHDLERRSDER